MNEQSASDSTGSLLEELHCALARLEAAPPLFKTRHQSPLLEICGQMMVREGGIESLYSLAPRLAAAGLFEGTDWQHPRALVPELVGTTLEMGERLTVILDCLSQLRMLSLAEGEMVSADMEQEAAEAFLARVLSHNLKYQFDGSDEALRIRLGSLGPAVGALYRFLLQRLGYGQMYAALIDEIWRILSQRPIQVNQVRGMITQMAVALSQHEGSPENRLGADRLISALFGPTQGTLDDPGVDEYRSRLQSMDGAALQQEAYGFARAMHDVGLVSDYHAVFLRWSLEQDQGQQIPAALGLSSTGLDVLRSYQSLIHALVEEAIFPQTAQSIYGLALLLESGSLYAPPIAPALWRQIHLPLAAGAEAALRLAFGDALPARVHLLAGVISLLGQPRGVAQGNNPTCQSARALSMWSYNDPDYLLHLISHAARYDNVRMHIEGVPIDSASLPAGLAQQVPLDTDPVSVVLVPHLDRIYAEMGRLCQGRPGDPHRWINPEFHGWWVGRDFSIAVDVETGDLVDYDQFLQQFYNSYHPYYNGNQPVIHPQPVGVAVTDGSGTFVGWHAITLLRIALDQEDVMRVYFYNPNNDSGQNWGPGVTVTTNGYGERFGEASLPFEQFLSRLYIFHSDAVDTVADVPVPAEELEQVRQMAAASWARDRNSVAHAAGEALQ
ncbi:MAG: hypothetical protein U5K56_21100 [Halioglobus sp.]|nr:hypothetical protein [Halioglobus sp.]